MMRNPRSRTPDLPPRLFAPFLIGALLLPLLGALSCAPSPDETEQTAPPSDPTPVVLVTIDTLRADRATDGGPMPRLAELARRGYRFSTAHTPVPMTLPAHATILTGLGPQSHGVRDNIGYALGAGVPTVAESFAEAGFPTAAFVAGYPLDRGFGLSRGFDLYDDRMTRAPGDQRKGHTERRADEVIDAALTWLNGHPDGPFFLWVHMFDPHDPYEAPSPYRERHADPYDAEAACSDHALGRLIDALLARGGKPPWILVTSDHGEALGDHGEATHGIFLYESTLLVPLVVVPPGPGMAGIVLDHPVTLADLAPTMLEAAGLPPLPASDGRSLLEVIHEREAGVRSRVRPLYIESIHPRNRYGWSPLSGFLDWPEKYVAAPRPELYDLLDDPEERDNLFEARREEALRERLDSIRGARGTADTSGEADLERLASLGYLGVSGGSLPEEALYDRPRPDPKDRIEAVPWIDRGKSAMVSGRDEEARQAFESALRADPDNLVALSDLGLLAMRAGDPAGAERFFREGLRRDASAEILANNLGLALGMRGRNAEAEEAFRRALELRPDFTMARFNLGVVLHRQNKSTEALKEFDRVSSEEPDFPGLRGFMDEARRAARPSR
jgi:arylsulfatase A-like enzyme